MSLGGFWNKTTMTVFKKYRLTALGALLKSHTSMKKPLPLLAALCLGGILASGTAQAASYYYTTNSSQTVTNNVFDRWQAFTFDKFNVLDEAKGPGQTMDLLGITVSVNNSYLIGQASISNKDAEPSDLTVRGYSSIFSVRTNNLGYTAFTNTISSVATSPDWTGTVENPIQQGQSLTLNLSPNQYFVNPGYPNIQNIANTLFSSYTGVGTVAFLLKNEQLITASGAQYGVDSSGAGAFTSMTVTYTYGVPEPSTYLLFGLGGLALVVAYRRKRAA
jgi:hypothetical protein